MIYPLISVTWHWDLIVTWDDSSIDESISQEILEVIFHVPQVPLGWATSSAHQLVHQFPRSGEATSVGSRSSSIIRYLKLRLVLKSSKICGSLGLLFIFPSPNNGMMNPTDLAYFRDW